MRYLTVDGMRSGTGVRDTYESGYLDLSELGLSEDLQKAFEVWVERYARCSMSRYSDAKECEALDQIGIELCRRLKEEVPDAKIEYYSDALCRKLRY